MFTRIVFRLLILLGACAPAWGQWTQLPGPSGGEIRSLAVRGVSAIAVSDQGNVFRSDGANWSQLPEMNAVQVFCVGGAYYADDFGSLLRSTNHGQTWQETGLERSIMSILRLQGKHAVLVASDRIGLFRSTDGGLRWDSVAAFGVANYLMDLDADEEYLYALTTGEGGGSILRRMHADSTQWSNAAATLPSPNIATRVEVAAGIITIYYYNDGIFRSADGGTTWQPLNAGLATQGTTLNDFASNYKGLFASTSRGVYKLKGETWQLVLPQRDALLVTTNSDDMAELWAASSGGVFTGGIDGEQWEEVNAGLNVHSIKDILTVGDGGVVAATPAGIFRSSNQGLTWDHPFATPVLQLAAEGNALLAMHDNYGNPGLSRSTDGGVSWTRATTNLPEPLIDLTSITAANGVFYLSAGYGESAGVWRSTDSCATWQHASAGLPTSDGQTPIAINAVAAHGTTVIAVTPRGAYWSGDAGIAWQASDLQIDGLFYRPVAAAAGGRFYIGNMDTLYSSADNGKTWDVEPIILDGESTIVEITAVGQSPVVLAESLIGFTGHPTQGWIWRDGAWANFTERLPERVWLTNIVGAGERLFVGTWGTGVWRASTAEVLGGTSAAPGHFTNAFKLLAYPNPVGDDARIHFTLEHPSHVVIQLLTPLGEVITTLFEGDADAGDHAVMLDASKLPAGVWFYRLTADGESTTEKFVKQ